MSDEVITIDNIVFRWLINFNSIFYYLCLRRLLNNIDRDQLLIKDRLKNNILPSCMGLFDLIVERRDDIDIIKLIVAGGYEKPYYIKRYGLSEEEFFEGVSILRNKELMRIFKDLELVEQLGSGIPRILEAYPKESFKFSENFLRVMFPSAERISNTPQVTPQVEKLLEIIEGELSREELQERLNLIDRKYFRKKYLHPAIKAGFVAMTIPGKPNSSKQKYYLTEEGMNFLEVLKSKDMGDSG